WRVGRGTGVHPAAGPRGVRCRRRWALHGDAPDPRARAERRAEHDPARPARRARRAVRAHVGAHPEVTAMTPTIDAATAARIRLVCFDVDGVLTDGGIVLGDAAGQRVELKTYDIQDGLGIVMLRQAGVLTA